MSVQLDMSLEEAQLMWCQIAAARKKYILPGMQREDLLMVGFGLGWIDARLDDLSRVAPPEARPTGNESQKP